LTCVSLSYIPFIYLSEALSSGFHSIFEIYIACPDLSAMFDFMNI